MVTFAIHLPPTMTKRFFSARMRKYAYQNSKEPCTVFKATKEYLDALKARIAKRKPDALEAYFLKLHFQYSTKYTH
jgi:hypothetical protein